MSDILETHVIYKYFIVVSEQCESMGLVQKCLEEMKIDFACALVEENGVKVNQLFFHDPDGFMIEICNCDNLPVIPLVDDMARSCSRLNHEIIQQQIPQVVNQIWSGGLWVGELER